MKYKPTTTTTLWIGYIFARIDGRIVKRETVACKTKQRAKNNTIALIMELAKPDSVVTSGVLAIDPHKETLRNNVLTGAITK